MVSCGWELIRKEYLIIVKVSSSSICMNGEILPA
jgi:hypothetical protein